MHSIESWTNLKAASWYLLWKEDREHVDGSLVYLAPIGHDLPKNCLLTKDNIQDHREGVEGSYKAAGVRQILAAEKP